MSNQEVLTIKSVSDLITVDKWREKQLQALKDNPFIEVLDSKTLKEAKANRTALKTARTDLEKQDKVIASRLSDLRKYLINTKNELVEITKPHEAKQQEEIDRYEDLKRKEKEEKIRLEEERKQKIQDKLSLMKKDISGKISAINNTQELKTFHVKDHIDSDFDFQEYNPSVLLLIDALNEERLKRLDQVEEAEKRKAEQERLEAERKKLEADRKELEAKRKADQERIDKQNEQIRLEKEKQEKELEEKRKAEQERIDKQNEELRKEREALESEKREKAEKERLEAEELKRKEETEKERIRLEELRPDKEKIKFSIEALEIQDVELKDSVSIQFMKEFKDSLGQLKDQFINQLSTLK